MSHVGSRQEVLQHGDHGLPLVRQLLRAETAHHDTALQPDGYLHEARCASVAFPPLRLLVREHLAHGVAGQETRRARNPRPFRRPLLEAHSPEDVVAAGCEATMPFISCTRVTMLAAKPAMLAAGSLDVVGARAATCATLLRLSTRAPPDAAPTRSPPDAARVARTPRKYCFHVAAAPACTAAAPLSSRRSTSCCTTSSTSSASSSTSWASSTTSSSFSSSSLRQCSACCRCCCAAGVACWATCCAWRACSSRRTLSASASSYTLFFSSRRRKMSQMPPTPAMAPVLSTVCKCLQVSATVQQIATKDSSKITWAVLQCCPLDVCRGESDGRTGRWVVGGVWWVVGGGR